MCPACLCFLTRRTDLATGPDEIRVSATNQFDAIINRLRHYGIVRSAVTLRVWLSVIISLAFLLPAFFRVKGDGQILKPYLTRMPVAPGDTTYRSLVARGTTCDVLPSCGYCYASLFLWTGIGNAWNG